MEVVYIKNMVCDRCIQSVRNTFEKIDVHPTEVKLGEVHLKALPSTEHMISLKVALVETGFEWIENEVPILVTKIKSALIELFDQDDIEEEFKLSTYLTGKFPYDYSHLSRVFSNHEKDTIEHFLIKLRVEKAKEYLSYKNRNVSEVAYQLGYASVAHFSRQFKKMVGMTPSKYQQNPTDRKSIEDI